MLEIVIENRERMRYCSDEIEKVNIRDEEIQFLYWPLEKVQDLAYTFDSNLVSEANRAWYMYSEQIPPERQRQIQLGDNYSAQIKVIWDYVYDTAKQAIVLLNCSAKY